MVDQPEHVVNHVLEGVISGAGRAEREKRCVAQVEEMGGRESYWSPSERSAAAVPGPWDFQGSGSRCRR